MILYYTGTGNSAYAAKQIAAATGDDCENLFSRLRGTDYSEIHSDRPFVLVSPTYGWQLPHIVRDWILKTPLTGNRDLYFVLTCGSETGNATKYLETLCRQTGMNFKGCTEIVMPENYIALFDAPEKDEALRIIEKAAPSIDAAIKAIKAHENLPLTRATAVDRFKSSLINVIFYPAFVHAKKFYATDNCTGCGKCVNRCVLHNISLENGKPVWGKSCTHCMACICGCPANAVEYGNASKGKPRYQCPKE